LPPEGGKKITGKRCLRLEKIAGLSLQNPCKRHSATLLPRHFYFSFPGMKTTIYRLVASAGHA
jgi:hypothetical protein